MWSVSPLRFSGTRQNRDAGQLKEPDTERAPSSRSARISPMMPSPLFYLGISGPLYPHAEMGADVFRKNVKKLDPDKAGLIAHELGHLLPGYAAGLRCAELSLSPSRRDGCESVGFTDFPTPSGNLRESLAEVVIRSGGLAGVMRLLSEKDLADPCQLQKALSGASQDMEDMCELLKDAGNAGWLDAEALQLPLVDFQNQQRMKQKLSLLKASARGVTPESRNEAGQLVAFYTGQLARFFQFPLFREAMETARSINEVIPLERQLEMFRYLNKKQGLNERQIEKFLNHFVTPMERESMADCLQDFVEKYSANNGKKLYNKGESKSTPWTSLLKKPASLYGTF